MNLPNRFEDFVVKEAPNISYYIPNFISVGEEENLIRQIDNAPKPKWTQLSNRRLQNWGGYPHPKGMVAEKIPSWLDKHLQNLSDMGLFEGKKANHVLVNEYLPGQGIMPHVDGPLFYPTITTINLGSHTVLDFYKVPREGDNHIEREKVLDIKSRYVGSFLLEARSLVCFKRDMYTSYMHGIEEICQDNFEEKNILNKSSLFSEFHGNMERSRRVSLTIRHFPKILNVRLKLGRK